jgi:hypothetical protein
MGTVSMPLVTTVDEHTYRLSNAYIEIYGPTYAYLYPDDDPSQTVLSTTLQTGNYSAYLYNWTLERADDSGNFGPVSATLVNYYNSFSIYNGTTTTLVFEFETDGLIVTVGSGDLNVNVAVTEIQPVCVPLGSDCGSGAWCPPTGLTGFSVACVAAGAVEVGQPCSGPADCVANASCFDAGAGPVCVELCAKTGVGEDCASGGTCLECEADYGLCLTGNEGEAAAPSTICPTPSAALPSVEPGCDPWGGCY